MKGLHPEAKLRIWPEGHDARVPSIPVFLNWNSQFGCASLGAQGADDPNMHGLVATMGRGVIQITVSFLLLALEREVVHTCR